ncbi:MAG: LLM class flavin-dependent oxidoreductase [Actinomycetota bacterium]
MRIDLALSPFGADATTLVDLAVAADADERIGGVWIADHFSGAVVGSDWSRDPFVCLGAIACSTRRIRLGPLVANVRNRHPAQLASAVNTLQSLAPNRIVLGMGSGAAPGSRFAVEHDAIGTDLGAAAERRDRLVAHVEMIRRLHVRGAGAGTVDPLDPRLAVTDGAPCPPIVVGASALATVEAAMTCADGVNLRAVPGVDDLIAVVRSTMPAAFELSVLTGADVAPARAEEFDRAGVDRLVVGLEADATTADLRAVVGGLLGDVQGIADR